MTAIVGAVNPETRDVFIGCDSAVTAADFSQFTKTGSKVVRNGPFLFGTTGSVRVGQLLRHVFQPPDHDPRWSIDKFMVTEVADRVRDCLKKGGALSVTNTNEEHLTAWSAALIGYRGHLYHLYGDLQMTESDAGFSAIGCAQDLGRGAMDILYEDSAGKVTADMIARALRTCDRFSGGVKAPYRVAVLPFSDTKIPMDLEPLVIKE